MNEPIYFEKLPAVLKVKDLELLLQVSHNTAYELIRSGQIHSVRIGRTYRIPREAVAAYLLKDFQKSS